MGVQSNKIELIKKYSVDFWDEVYRQESVTSVLDGDKDFVKFTGEKTVLIGKWANGGMYDYFRNNIGDDRIDYNGIKGFENGAVDGVAASQAGLNASDFVGHSGFGYRRSGVELGWEEFTLKCDRAAAFPIEYFDNEESGAKIIGKGVTQISRTAIIPEVDAYCLSKLASFCSTQLGNLVYEGITTPLSKLNKGFLFFDNNEVPEDDQVCFVSPNFLNALRETSEVTKFLAQTDFNNKNVKFKITEYEGRRLIMVSPQRFRTDIDIFGKQGYGWKSTSRPINFLLVSLNAVAHVVKYNKIKVVGGDLNLSGNGFDGYTIYARVYHDVFVPDNKRTGLYCSVNSTDSYEGRSAEAQVTYIVSGATKKVQFNKLSYFPAGTMGVKFYYALGTTTPTSITAANIVTEGTITDDLAASITGGTTKLYIIASMDGTNILATGEVLTFPASA